MNGGKVSNERKYIVLMCAGALQQRWFADRIQQLRWAVVCTLHLPLANNLQKPTVVVV
jgi:hypothetical protein